MAQEARLQLSLQIKSGNLTYQSQPTVFTADMTGSKGPCPGAITVSPAGTDVDFGQLATPALCRIMNLDATNFVSVGIWDPIAVRFHPLAEILHGESYILRLSRHLHQEYGTGTGTGLSTTTRLRIRADRTNCNVVVEAFER